MKIFFSVLSKTPIEVARPTASVRRVVAGQRAAWLVIVGLMVVGFVLRRKGLATQSLWFDEADLVARAQQGLPAIFGNFLKAGENGPFYTLFMHFWMQVAGTGEAAVRTPSLIAGIAAIPLIFLVGRKLAGTAVGLVAATLLTIAPYAIWYSQDAKMYSLVMALTLASVWLFLKALEQPGWVWWLLYAVVTTLAVYVHVMAVLVVVVQWVYYFANRPARRLLPASTRRKAIITLGVMTLPYLPLALWQSVALWDGTIGSKWFGPVGLLDMFNSLGRRFAVNRSLEPWETIGAVTFALLALVGLVMLWRSRSTNAALFLTLYFWLPLLGFYLLTTRIPLFADRYLILAAPAYYLLIAVGLVRLAQMRWTGTTVSTVGSAVLVACVAVALVNFNLSDEPQKENWREAMKRLSERVRPGDTVVVIPGYLKTAVDYYFKPQGVSVQTIPQELIDDHDDAALNDALQKIIRDHERAWLVTSPERYTRDEPKTFVRDVWFNYNTRMFTDPQTVLGVTFYGYSFSQIPGTDREFFPRTGKTDYTFGNALKLEGFDIRPNAAKPNPSDKGGMVKVGDSLHLSLFWRMLTPNDQNKTNYGVAVRLLDKNGQDTDTNYLNQPFEGYYPTTKWRQNESLRDYRDIFIKVPPGSYQLEISVYPLDTPQTRLSLPDGSTKVVLNFPVTVVS